MSLGLILVIILVIALFGGFSGRFGGYGTTERPVLVVRGGKQPWRVRRCV